MIVFLVPVNYKKTGGYYLPLNHYENYLKSNNYRIEIIEMPYHKDRSLESISKKIDSICVDEENYIIGYTLNICYLMIRYMKLHQKYNCTCYFADSLSLNINSIMKHNVKSFFQLKYILRNLLYTYKEKYCLSRCDKSIYVSEVDKNYVTEKYHCNPDNIFVIKNGTDQVVCDSRAIKINRIILGTLTGFSKETVKNDLLPFVNNIFPKIIEKYPEIKFVIAGRGADVNTASILRNKTNVVFLGEVENLGDFYDKVDIIVTTVKKECGIINRIMEAWSYNKVVVGYKRNFMAFDDAIDGVHYISADNSDDFVKAIEKIKNNIIDCNKIRNNATLLVKNNYRWEDKGEKLIKVIKL